MPFERPTLSQTIAEVEAGLASRLDGADTRLHRAVLTVLARVMAGIVYGLDAFIAYVAKQILPMTADEEHLPRLARPWRIFRKSADYAEGVIAFTGADGSYLAVGTLWQRADGVQYKVTAEAAVNDGIGLCPVMALEAGSEGNAVVGTTVVLVKSQPGINLGGTVAQDGIAGGVDVEDIENTRSRLVKRWQEPPRGGSVTDWEAWALEVPGVFKVWPQKNWMGYGTVGILFITEDEDNPIPDVLMVQRVNDHLTSFAIKPILSQKNIFYSQVSGEFVIPSGVSSLLIVLTGGGGSGALAPGVNEATGGSAAGTAIGVIPVKEGEKLQYTIGAGGVVPSTIGQGCNGGASSCGKFTAHGGNGGHVANNAFAAGAVPGGTSSGAIINLVGNPSEPTNNYLGDTYASGNGGSSFWGGAGCGTSNYPWPDMEQTYIHARGAGSGGGAASPNTQNNQLGAGNGADGCIAIFY